MSVISASSGPIAGGGGSTTVYENGFTNRPVILTADTEQALSLPVGTKAFMLKNVGSVEVRYAYNLGDTTANYITLSPHSYKWMTDLDGTARTIYVRSSRSSHQLELEYWT